MIADVTMTVRPAESADHRALCELLLAFHEHHARALPGRLTTMRDPGRPHGDELANRVRHLLAARGANLLVAEQAGELVGLAELYLRQSDPSAPVVPRTYAYLQSLIVLEDARGAGVGAALLAAAEQWARRRGAAELQVDTWEYPGGAVGFYERHGYTTMRRAMVRPL